MDNYMEKIVLNKANETNLKYIGIFGLFNRYDVRIAFDKQVKIFIGENGLGKTTILNCIYFLLEKNFLRLEEIQFEKIQIIFSDEKIYEISDADIREYNRSRKRKAHGKYGSYRNYQYLIEDIIENTYINQDDSYNTLENVALKLARIEDIPLSVAKRQIKNYIMNKKFESVHGKTGNENNVIELIKAISDNVKHRIIYLPTYRRIEDDFDSLNLGNQELNKTELLIRFGMSDVQASINNLLQKIRSIAMRGFAEMTGVLLKQYIDGKDVIKEYKNLDYETVKIVLDRVGTEIEPEDKDKILYLVKSGKIRKRDNLYLWNLISKLIDNYGQQKEYDDRIKRFADTCNKYLIDKQFNYNQSTLELNVVLENNFKNEEETIDLIQLSSGEKQIVSIFSKLYLESDEKSIIIIDEPELSLSLEWQKMLLPDIMRTENCDLLLTVTHSPFIFDNEFDFDAEDMRRYIKPIR